MVSSKASRCSLVGVSFKSIVCFIEPLYYVLSGIVNRQEETQPASPHKERNSSRPINGDGHPCDLRGDYWGKQPKGTFTLSVASDGAIAGTVDVVIQGVDVISNVPGTQGTPFPAPANSVHVTGNWTCNVYH